MKKKNLKCSFFSDLRQCAPSRSSEKLFSPRGVISQDNGRYIDDNQLSVILLIFHLLGHCAVVNCKCLFEESCREGDLIRVSSFWSFLEMRQEIFYKILFWLLKSLRE